MAQVALVAHQHDDDVAVSVVTQLLQPAFHILLCQVLGDVLHPQPTHCTTVLRQADGAVALLACGFPDLGLDGLAIPLDVAGGKFHANGALAL